MWCYQASALVERLQLEPKQVHQGCKPRPKSQLHTLKLLANTHPRPNTLTPTQYQGHTAVQQVSGRLLMISSTIDDRSIKQEKIQQCCQSSRSHGIGLTAGRPLSTSSAATTTLAAAVFASLGFARGSTTTGSSTSTPVAMLNLHLITSLYVHCTKVALDVVGLMGRNSDLVTSGSDNTWSW
jgi:hypothetical protein